MKIAISPTELFLMGNDHQSAVALLDEIGKKTRKVFDKESLRAEVGIGRIPNGSIQLYVIKELEKAGWTAIHFSTEGGSATISMVANITPEQKKKYLE
jgi:hypothetical protein